MKFLLCSPISLNPRLGAPKVLIELADALRSVGAFAEVVGPQEIGVHRTFGVAGHVEYQRALRNYLLNRAADFDVIEVDHEHLPFPRDTFHLRPLVVARSVLLVHHLRTIRFPRRHTLRNLAGRAIYGRRRDALLSLRIRGASQTLRAADLVNVSNECDLEMLVEHGVPRRKIVVLPFGLSAARRQQFERCCRVESPLSPCVGFVGTFDLRKGSTDFPRIVQQICQHVPAARFRLLGTDGMLRGTQAVLRHFPRRLRSRIEVVPEFDPCDLPALLADVSVGIFPSYCEGFGFGILEMLAAAVPVVAYNVPGPGSILPAGWLVPSGASAALANRAAELLCNIERFRGVRIEARRRSELFDWEDIARRTIDTYGAAIERRSTHAAAVTT